MSFKISKIPSDELSLKNRLVFHPEDIKKVNPKYKEDTGNGEIQDEVYVTLNGKRFGVCSARAMKFNTVGLSAIQRKWIGVGLETDVQIRPEKMTDSLSAITVEADFLQKQKVTKEAYDTDKMVEAFRSTFSLLPFTEGQEIVFKLDKLPYLCLRVTGLKAFPNEVDVKFGLLTQNTQVVFDKREDSVLLLSGKAKGKSAMPSIINPDWNFSQMGIGGLDKEFSAIFRRAFASRVFPPDLIEQLGMQHVKGILLHGPPGTGKTLMARQIGKMLNAREPKIVNGPEILNKFVGESEANIRKLFEDAENDQKKFGANSGLHMIIFDEIDAICKQRGSVTGSTGVADTVVNQLLSKIDGVEQLNNILVIGMTNRKDLIDDALLRPGRLEVQMEIGLPSEDGRLQIIEIHTAKLYKFDKIAHDVNLKELAAATKNFSGAELEGVVRAATTTAMNRLVKAEGTVKIDPNAIEELRIARADFLHAIDFDIRPSFGAAIDDSDHYISNGIIEYGKPIEHVIQDGALLVQQTRMGKLVSPVSVLLEGPVGSGKTALAAHLAYKLSDFPFIKVVSPENMIGFSESAKCQAIKKIFDDAYKSELSCVIVDDIERLIDYVPIGPRFSNVILQALIVLLKKKLKKGRKLLIIGTTSCRDVLDQMQMLSCFNTIVHVPSITKIPHLIKVLTDLQHFNEKELQQIESEMSGKNICINVKKLINLVEMAVQSENHVMKFIILLEEQCGIP